MKSQYAKVGKSYAKNAGSVSSQEAEEKTERNSKQVLINDLFLYNNFIYGKTNC